MIMTQRLRTGRIVLALALLGAYEVRNRLRSSRGAFRPDDESAEESLARR